MKNFFGLQLDLKLKGYKTKI